MRLSFVIFAVVCTATAGQSLTKSVQSLKKLASKAKSVFDYATCSVAYGRQTIKNKTVKVLKTPTDIVNAYTQTVQNAGLGSSTLLCEQTLNSVEMIYRFGLYSAMPYCSPDELSKFPTLKVGGQPLLTGAFRVVQAQRGTTQNWMVVVNEQQQQVMLIYRGSVNLMDYFTAMNIVPQEPQQKYFPNAPKSAKLFWGMQDYFKRKFASIGALVRAHQTYPQFKVVVVGHSLGGAMAYLAALHLGLTKKVPVFALYTYGQPKTGNQAFDTWHRKVVPPQRFIRVVSYNDLVPYLFSSKSVEWCDRTQEYFVSNPQQPAVQHCQNQWECSATTGSCATKTWENHSRYGGMWIGTAACRMTKVVD